MTEKTVQLDESELKLFERLGKNRDGKILLGLFAKLKVAWSDLSVLTPETFASRKDAIQLIEESFIKPVESYRERKNSVGKSEYI